MKTKELIEFLKRIKNLELYSDMGYVFEADETIKLLQRGEKYEAMWGEFHYGLAHINIGSYRNPCDERKMTDMDCVNEIVRDVKQKYFPKKVIK